VELVIGLQCNLYFSLIKLIQIKINRRQLHSSVYNAKHKTFFSEKAQK